MSRIRVAIAHDYLTQRGGAERVVLSLARAFPGAPIYTTLYDDAGTYPEFRDLDVRVSWLNRLPLFRRRHRLALPLLPIASQTVKIDADVVVASSSGWAHGFRTDGKLLVYCYTPARWLYEPQTYVGENDGRVARLALGILRPALVAWDRRAAKAATSYLAISSVTQKRLRQTYGIEAPIMAAPANLAPSHDPIRDVARLPPPGYLLVVSRLLPYKNVMSTVRAASLLRDLRFVIVGAGPELSDLKRAAPGNVTFLQDVSDAELNEIYRRSRGLIAASHEDFGLTPLEAAARGKPTAALRGGGFLDTVRENETGVFFEEPLPEEIAIAVKKLLSIPWNPEVLLRHAEMFSEDRFIEQMHRAVHEVSRMQSPD